MKYTIILCIVFIFCSKPPQEPKFSVLAKGKVIEQSFLIEEIKTRAKVKKERNPNLFSLEFEEKNLELVLKYKPDRILLKLPFVNSKEIYVPIRYEKDKLNSSFLFPSGWIDSSELEVIFYVKGQVSFLVSPDSIYSPLGTEHFVIKIKDGIANHVPVSIQGIQENQIIVTGSLDVGDTILVSRLSESVHATRVKVKL